MTERPFVGNNSITKLGDLLDELKASRVLIVTGKNSFAASGAEAALAPYLASLSVERFSEFGRNPNLEDALAGRERVRSYGPDVIVSVGGGSVIDTAKLINVLAAQAADAQEIITGQARISRAGLPSIAIPTTAGAGSEATHFAVVYVGDEKYSLAHPDILPTFAIVDPTLSHTLPPYLTASCGFDALSQAIESYWSVGATEESQRYAHEAIQRVMRSLSNAVLQPDAASREDMARAAHLAGQAINITRTTGAHALSYPLTIHHGIHHGHAVALTLGNWFVFNSRPDSGLNDPRGAVHLERVVQDLCTLIGGVDAEACRRILLDLMAEVGLETDLERLGISGEADFQRIVDNVNLERLGNNPVKISRRGLYQLISNA